MIEIPINVHPTLRQKFINYCKEHEIDLVYEEAEGWSSKLQIFMDLPNFMKYLDLSCVKYRGWHYRQSFLDEVEK